MAVKKELDIKPLEVKPEVSVSVSAIKATDRELVEIVTKETFKVMYGDRWYHFTKGVPVKVPKEMKVFLNKQNALAVI